MSRFALFAGLLLMAVVAVVLIFTSKSGGRGLVDEGSITDGVRESTTSERAKLKSHIGGASNEQLPDVDTPLRLVVDDLKRQADNGNPSAMCRLAAEWDKCDDLRTKATDARRSLMARERVLLNDKFRKRAQVDGQTLKTMEQGLAYEKQEIKRLQSLLEHCEGVPAPEAGEEEKYWRRAALAGHLPSMRQYAVGNAFQKDEILNNLPALATYRDEAVALAHRAVDRGDLTTAIALAGAYSPLTRRGSTFLSQLVEPNAVESLKYLYMTRSAVESARRFTVNANLRSELLATVSELESVMTPAEVQLARSRAMFASPLHIDERELRNLYLLQYGFVAGIGVEACERH